MKAQDRKAIKRLMAERNRQCKTHEGWGSDRNSGSIDFSVTANLAVRLRGGDTEPAAAADALAGLGFPRHLIEGALAKALKIIGPKVNSGAGEKLEGSASSLIPAFVAAAAALLEDAGTVLPAPRLLAPPRRAATDLTTSATVPALAFSGEELPSPDEGGFTVATMRALGTEEGWYMVQASRLHPEEPLADLATVLLALQKAVKERKINPRERLWLRRAILAGAFDGVRLVSSEKGGEVGGGGGALARKKDEDMRARARERAWNPAIAQDTHLG